MNKEPWVEVDQKLYKQFVFKDFTEALSWMLKAAFVIEKLNHHPEWSNVYNKVTVYLTTHDAGNTITQKDRDLAKALDLV
jgi:4a-hydroxytetrahydrobiopterin dehydratase